ncbi:MAG: Flp family type IVb pilin [Candidatus Methylomirabilaceae bacterium]
MFTLRYAWIWLNTKLNRDEAGQGASEYVLLILGVVLFLILAAMGLRTMLGTAVSSISSWVAAVSAGGPATTP